jgi:hypothetical protein
VKTKYKIALVVVAVASIVGIVAAVLIRQENKKYDETPSQYFADISTAIVSASPAVSPSVSSSSSSATAVSDWHIYRNSKYNFELTFSDVWRGYQAKEATPINGSETKIDFVLDDKVLMSILVYKTEVWDDSAKGKVPATELGKSGDYTFVYQALETPPPELAQITEKEIAAVAKTFEFK